MSCSTGVKRRIVECSGRGECNAKTQPESITSCNLGPCPQWNIGKWSQVNSYVRELFLWHQHVNSTRKLIALLLFFQCSVSCGVGIKTRAVSCTGEENQCDPESKPKSVIHCHLAPCPVWQTGQWSKVQRFALQSVEGTLKLFDPPPKRQGGRSMKKDNVLIIAIVRFHNGPVLVCTKTYRRCRWSRVSSRISFLTT